ncbi:phage holin family protein [Modestobacter sp. VKM Ac-2986]|uniref:phage holin family protein n=1 Tax=Modestobacter sp. VKM Ac-2986 TaxID=3004140 RepID=UPI0022AB6340|nr:phage holin family protein [Modestobacter sp. VKM Ac-2986]MCZ2830888.1 phage holin family protein [Modestobacter sp. VKM Ac-2986]
MSGPTRPGRVLRGGRTLARLLLVWATVSGVLVVLDRWLSGFAMRDRWQPPVAALVLGVLAAVVWPLVMRIALPIAVFTFGLGSFLLLGGGVLAVALAIPGVEVRSFGTALVVAVAMAATAGVISSVLAVNEDEVFYRRTRRRGRHAPDAGECPPGVVFLQIDGLGHEVARRAVRDGSMPTLAAWLRAGSHELRAWHTDWSSQTGASQCGILQGSNDDVLGFRWYEKEHDRVVTVSSPGDAAEIERRHSDGRGLLAGDGAGRGNLFTGDAAHVSLTMSSLAVVGRRSRRERRTRDRIGAGYYGYFANPVNALRTLCVYVVDVFRELSAAAAQRRADVRPRIRRGGVYPLVRPATTVLTRDVVVNAIVEDVLAGRPVVYADLVGYDEVAHHSGIERFDALDVLRGIDQQVGRLWRAIQLAPRRYHLVCLSDHGQTQGEAFADRFGETVEELVGRLAGAEPPAPRRRLLGLLPPPTARTTPGWQMTTALAEASSGGGMVARRLRARVERTAAREAPTPPGEPGAVTRVAPGVVVTVSGHMAMVSFTDHPGRVPLETIEQHWPDLLPSLVDHAGIGFMLVHSEEFGPVVLGREGLHRLRTGVVIGTDPLAPYGPHAHRLVARASGFAHCPDVVVNSAYDPVTDEASPFEPHVGSHGGLGGPQQHGFLLAPRAWADPGEVVGAEHLHRVLRGWLTDLGHPEPAGDAPADDAALTAPAPV